MILDKNRFFLSKLHEVPKEVTHPWYKTKDFYQRVGLENTCKQSPRATQLQQTSIKIQNHYSIWTPEKHQLKLSNTSHQTSNIKDITLIVFI